MSAPRVLVVDDNVMNIELARFVLEADGMVVSTATDAELAMAALARVWPDLVLLDIQMPVQDGLTLARRIRDLPQGQGIRLVAFTAFAMKGDDLRFLASGCDGYLAKPIEVATFAASVRALLGNAHAVGDRSGRQDADCGR